TVVGGLSPVLSALYRYDALGRRIAKEVTQAGSTTITRYIYDNEDILLELDGANVLQARYTHGPGIDEPLVMLRGTQAFFYHVDALGSVWDLTDSTGTIARSYTYDSFGQLLAQTGTLANPYTYTARELDPETGLYYYRARYYDPTIGRFLQEDPLGLAGGINLYPYVGNSPLNFADSLGLVRIRVNIDLGSTIRLNQQIRSALDFVPNFILDALFPVEPEEILEASVSNLVCPLSTVGRGARFFGEGLRRIKTVAGTRLAQQAGGPIEVFNSQLTGGLRGAIKFFQQQVGRLPAGRVDMADVGGRRFVFRPSRTGPPTVDVVDLARRTWEKIRFLE
ncbi:MAG: RHS repeat-associated core domain-containing protein, partial [Dehalococcoidia bacterium]